MDYYTFISELIGSLSWPVTVVVVLFLMRKEVRSLIPSLKRLKYKDFELAFEKKAVKLEKHAKNIYTLETDNVLLPSRSIAETIDELIKVSPRLAVIESFAWLESAIRDATERHEICRNKYCGVRNGFRAMLKHNLINDDYMSLFNELRTLRNELSHNIEDNISVASARIYAENALALANIIKQT